MILVCDLHSAQCCQIIYDPDHPAQAQIQMINRQIPHDFRMPDAIKNFIS